MDAQVSNCSVNVTSEWTDTIPQLYDTLFIINLSLVFPICAGNILIIISILRLPQVTPSDHFIMGLASVDFFVGLTQVPTYSVIQYHPMQLHTRQMACTISLALYFFSLILSLNAFFLISLDRYLAVKHPFKYQTWMQGSKVLAINLGNWILSFLASFLMIPAYTWDEQCNRCIASLIMPLWQRLLLSVFFIVPFLATPICHITVGIIAHKQQCKIIAEQSRLGNETSKQQKNITRLVGTVLILFYICWVPFLATNTLKGVYSGEQGPEWLEIMAECCITLTFSNSLLNPAVYLWRNKKYRKSVMKMFGCIHGDADMVTSSHGKHR